MEEQTNSEVQSSTSKPDRRKLYIGLLVAGIIALIVVIIVWSQARTADPQEQARKEAQELVATVSKLIVLPEDEEPVIATVADPSQLGDQPFFEKAQKGDKVLIFNNARKAVLYSPSENRIIEVAPLNLGEPPQEQ